MDSVKCNSDMVATNSICVQIEHRFYGESVPPLASGGGNNDNFMQGLNVEAALEDTAAVIDAVQAMYPSPTPRPVVIWGGSYSGATATWFRMSHPEYSAGAISSSGVVNAIYEFVEFDEVIAEAINTPDDACAGTLRDIQSEIDTYFTNGDGDSMKKLFNATDLIGTKHGDADFMYMLADGYSMIDQYGGKAELCDGLRSDPTMDGLNTILHDHFGADFGNDCYYNSECLKIENNQKPVGGLMGSQNSRSWRWQKCNEVGYLQSRPDTDAALRSPLLTIEALEEQCVYVFGSMPAKDGGNAALNAKFGAADTSGATNVFSISYKDDPWKAASVTETNGETLPYCYADCDGCGHCGAGVSDEDSKICGDPQSVFVEQILAQDRFQGHFSDPNHPGCDRSVVVKVDSKVMDVSVSGFDYDDNGDEVAWGPLPTTVEGVEIVVDFSSKGGPADLTGTWDATMGAIVWKDGNAWTKL
jgi:hypothetical protein